MILLTYTLESVAAEPLSPFVGSGVDALRFGPLDFDELIHRLRLHRVGIRHVFKPDVAMAMEYLKKLGVVSEQVDDLTEKTLAELRARPVRGRHLRPCPSEASQGIVRKGLVSLYAQYRLESGDYDGRIRTSRLRFSPAGVLCIYCGYHRVDSKSIAKL